MGQKSNTFVKMPKENKKEKSNSSDLENQMLKNRIKDLESKLETAEMKAISYSTMIDIAERELKIPIRKKYNTKPSKK